MKSISEGHILDFVCVVGCFAFLFGRQTVLSVIDMVSCPNCKKDFLFIGPTDNDFKKVWKCQCTISSSNKEEFKSKIQWKC